jgi:enoyl-CoA hydratase/carnithine racemase
MPPLLLVDRTAGVVRLTLNRPEKRNALSVALLQELEQKIAEIRADSAVRVIILAALGPAFCAGHDLSEMIGQAEAAYRELFDLCTRVMLGLRNLPQPVIARVHGMATAAGCQLVASCDLAVAADEASFATPGVKIGLFCTTPMVPLVQAVPAKAAMEMLLTGVPLSARRAMELGLINRVVKSSELDATIQTLADTIVSMSPRVIALGKKAFYDIEGLDEPDAYARAVPIMTANAAARDAQEGMTAFLEKRPPRWSGA